MNQFYNIPESWPIYDTITICRDLYGQESGQPGFFPSFAAFAQRSDHSLFKMRSEALAGLPYNNQASQDRVDFAFHAFSIGLAFYGPSWANEGIAESTENDAIVSAFWQMDLPRYIGVEFRIGPDVKLSGTCMRLPPGYGPRASGIAHGIDTVQENVLAPQCIVVPTQGEASIGNRFRFKPPVDLPRNETIEVKLYLSDVARYVLNQLAGPGYITWPTQFAGAEVPEFVTATKAARYGIQASLWGIREVQQRGELHA